MAVDVKTASDNQEWGNLHLGTLYPPTTAISPDEAVWQGSTTCCGIVAHCAPSARKASRLYLARCGMRPLPAPEPFGRVCALGALFSTDQYWSHNKRVGYWLAGHRPPQYAERI